jgi:hypothetical protein
MMHGKISSNQTNVWERPLAKTAKPKATLLPKVGTKVKEFLEKDQQESVLHPGDDRKKNSIFFIINCCSL